MFDEEDVKPKAGMTPQALVLDDMSVDAMQEYIGWLEAEIARVKAEIAKRGDVKLAAESLFKA